MRADQRGQTAAEYLGVLLALTLLLGGVWGSGLPRRLAAAGVRAATCRIGGACAAPVRPAPGDPLPRHLAELEAERAALLAVHPWLAADLPGLGDEVRRALDGIGALFDLGPPERGPLVVVDQLVGWPERHVSIRSRLAEVDERIARFRGWAAERRRILALDPAGDGMVVEVLGDTPLEDADHVAVVVPGVYSDVQTYDRQMRPRAAALHEIAVTAADPERVATVVWLGYDPPDAALTWGSATGGSAAAGGRELARFVAELDARARGGQHQTLIGHSYGTIVIADALAAGADVDQAVLLGSPGVRRENVAALNTGADVWVAKTVRDEIDLVPNVRVGPLGHGPDPTGPGFGGRRLDTGDAAGHGGYFSDLDALAALADVIVGRSG